MSRVVLLVTGARALTESPAADVWARDVLRERIMTLPSDAIVVTGDASGPDDWAAAIASSRGLVVTVYDKRGWRSSWRAEGRKVIVLDKREWCLSTSLRPETSEEWKSWLLQRDRTMVNDVSRAHHAAKIEAKVVALFAPWARTQGTAYTYFRALDARLSCERLVCDDALTPSTKTSAKTRP